MNKNEQEFANSAVFNLITYVAGKRFVSYFDNVIIFGTQNWWLKISECLIDCVSIDTDRLGLSSSDQHG